MLVLSMALVIYILSQSTRPFIISPQRCVSKFMKLDYNTKIRRRWNILSLTKFELYNLFFSKETFEIYMCVSLEIIVQVYA